MRLIDHSAGRNVIIPWNLRSSLLPLFTINDSRVSRKRNKIGLSTISVVGIARSSKKLAPIPGGDLPQLLLPPLELPRQILHNYRGERGTFFPSPSRELAELGNCRSIRHPWQKASPETWTISRKESNRGERGNPVSIATVTNVNVKDRYESSLASNTKRGKRERERGREVISLRISPTFCERTLDLP